MHTGMQELKQCKDSARSLQHSLKATSVTAAQAYLLEPSRVVKGQMGMSHHCRSVQYSPTLTDSSPTLDSMYSVTYLAAYLRMQSGA